MWLIRAQTKILVILYLGFHFFYCEKGKILEKNILSLIWVAFLFCFVCVWVCVFVFFKERSNFFGGELARKKNVTFTKPIGSIELKNPKQECDCYLMVFCYCQFFSLIKLNFFIDFLSPVSSFPINSTVSITLQLYFVWFLGNQKRFLRFDFHRSL